VTTNVSTSGNVVVKKDKKIDTRKLFLEIRATDLVHVESANPDHEEQVRKLAATIEGSARSAAEAKKRREQSIEDAEKALADTRLDKSAIVAAEAELASVKAGKSELDRARAEAGLEALPEQFFTPARRRKRILIWSAVGLIALIAIISAAASLGGGANPRRPRLLHSPRHLLLLRLRKSQRNRQQRRPMTM
jgi:hypothetical protein